MAIVNKSPSAAGDAAARLNRMSRASDSSPKTSPRKRANSNADATVSPSKRMKATPSVEKGSQKSQLQRRSTKPGGSLPTPRSRDPYAIPDDQKNEPASTPIELPPKPVRILRRKRAVPSFPKEGVDGPPPSPEKTSSPAKTRKSTKLADKTSASQGGEEGVTSTKPGPGRPRKTFLSSPKAKRGMGAATDGPNNVAQTAEREVEGSDDHQHELGQAEEVQVEGKNSKRIMKHKLPDFWGRQTFVEFEEQACLYDCREHWEKMLLAARLNRGSVVKPSTKIVGELENSIRATQKCMDGARGNSKGKAERTAYRCIEELKQSLPDLRTTTGDKPNLVRDDLYTVAIPSLVFFMKNLVKFYFDDGALSYPALDEVIKLMGIIRDACSMAANWVPRPSQLDNRVVGDTRVLIAANLRRILEAYEGEKRVLDRELLKQALYEEREIVWRERQEAAKQQAEDDRRKLEKYRARRAKELADREEEYQARQREIKRKTEEKRILRSERQMRGSVLSRGSPGFASNRYQRARTSARILAPKSKADNIFDVDDFDFGGDQISDSPQTNRTPMKSAVARGKLPERPRSRAERQSTEDIPAPMPTKPEWRRDELEALISGLERYTGSDRFERILNESAFGCLDKRLARRDMDDLMEQARFLKRAMQSELKETLGSEYNWLRSVPE